MICVWCESGCRDQGLPSTANRGIFIMQDICRGRGGYCGGALEVTESSPCD